MEQIPKIIHQIWSGVNEPLPNHFKILGETWKEHHPSWKYEFWDNTRMNNFILEFYPQHWNTYNSFIYNVQRWDAIRYLILDKFGGMYVDFDSECLKPLDDLFLGNECCFSMEPKEHGIVFNKNLYFNNALMASIPEHPFMKKIIEKVFCYTPKAYSLSLGEKIIEILTTTGPLLLVDLYEKELQQEKITLIPSKYVSPYTDKEIKLIMQGDESKQLETKLNEAYSIHYFFNGWVN